MFSSKAAGQLLHYSQGSQGRPQGPALSAPCRLQVRAGPAHVDAVSLTAHTDLLAVSGSTLLRTKRNNSWQCTERNDHDFQPSGSEVVGALEKWHTNYSFKAQALSNGGWFTHPLRHMTSRASRYPWYAARRVGVIPSSSEVLRSFLVASFKRSKLPSAAALWYLLDIFCNFCFPKAVLSDIRAAESPFHYRDRSLMITSWDVPVRMEMRRQSSSQQAAHLQLCIGKRAVLSWMLSFSGRWLCHLPFVAYLTS